MSPPGWPRRMFLLVLVALALRVTDPPRSNASQPGRRVEVVPSLRNTETTGGGRHAIVVGIDDYASKDVQRLAGAVADAKAIARALITYADFSPSRVTVLTSDGSE